MKKDSCTHANSSRMLCWACALPAEDVPNSLAQIQMAGCRLSLPANKPREYICINTAPCSHLPSPSPAPHRTQFLFPECHLQPAFQNLYFSGTWGKPDAVLNCLEGSQHQQSRARPKKKKNSISGFWQLVRKICWVILIFFPKRKNRWGFTFYLMQTLCSPRPFLYLSTLKFGGFSAKLKEFHNCSRIL